MSDTLILADKIFAVVVDELGLIKAQIAQLEKTEKDLKRAFGGGGLPGRTPVKHWVCFYLARELGNLGDPAAVDSLLAVLEQCPPEASLGYPDPADPAVLFLHNDLTPCWRADSASSSG